MDRLLALLDQLKVVTIDELRGHLSIGEFRPPAGVFFRRAESGSTVIDEVDVGGVPFGWIEFGNHHRHSIDGFLQSCLHLAMRRTGLHQIE